MNPAGGVIPKVLILMAFAVILGVPWVFRPEEASAPAGAERLVILTPHNEPIRYEYGRAFSAWHMRTHGKPVLVDWRVPGGSSEIKKLLIAQYTAAVETGRILSSGELGPGAEPMPYDLLFGGGSFEHDELKTKGPTIVVEGSEKPRAIPISIPLGYSAGQLEEWFGPAENDGHKVGINWLYDVGDPKKNDPGQYYLGNALSGFGIVYNRDVLRELGLPDPTSWTDMTDPRLAGWVALADPRLSGSVATTYESILYSYGWDDGWRILRAMCANSRYFSNTSQKVPLDVSQGQAAVGTAIDFYGRFQSQSLLRPGQAPEDSRVGYVDPPGVTLIDPDPISMLRAGASPVIARRFIEYLMSIEGQALWNFSKIAGDSADALGPERYELRRLPIRRVMFEQYTDRMIDKVDPYAIASKAENKNWRSSIGVMMGAFAIDIHDEQVHAWRAIQRARVSGASEASITEAEQLFFAWPVHTAADGKQLEFIEANYKAIRADWREAEKDGRMNAIRLGYTAFFRQNYARVAGMFGSN